MSKKRKKKHSTRPDAQPPVTTGEAKRQPLDPGAIPDYAKYVAYTLGPVSVELELTPEGVTWLHTFYPGGGDALLTEDDADAAVAEFERMVRDRGEDA